MMSIALAKKVQIKGSDRVSSSPLYSSSTKKQITERKNRIQYSPVDFLVFSMLEIYAKIIQKFTFAHL